MEKQLNQVYHWIQKLIGLHRQLLDSVRMERRALVDANLKEIEEATLAKQALVEAIRQAETERQKETTLLAHGWKIAFKDLTLSRIVIEVQAYDQKRAEQFRSAQNALTLLAERIREQNEDNRLLLEKSMHHVDEMKHNVLREASPKTDTYNQAGQKSHATQSSRLISKEA